MQVKRQLKSAQESKRINTAKECWEHLSKLFTSSNWSEDHANKKVGQYIALWRDQTEMDRPRSVIEHARCEGIHAARSFLVTAASGVGVLLMRPWDCWCMACLAIEGRGVGNMSGKDGHSQLRVASDGNSVSNCPTALLIRFDSIRFVRQCQLSRC